jgi:hypothetical protein
MSAQFTDPDVVTGRQRLATSTTSSMVSDTASHIAESASNVATSASNKVKQVSTQVSDTGAEYVRNAQIRFYEKKITTFLVERLKEFYKGTGEIRKAEQYTEQTKNDLIKELSNSDIFSQIDNLIKYIENDIKPKSIQFDVLKDEIPLLKEESMPQATEDNEYYFTQFRRKELIENLNNYKKFDSAHIVDLIFNSTNSIITDTARTNLDGFKSFFGREVRVVRFNDFYIFLLKDKKNLTDKINKLTECLHDIYSSNLISLQKYITMDVEKVSKFINKTVIPDAKIYIYNHSKKRDSQNVNDSSLSSYKVVPDVAKFFGFSKENLDKIQAEGDENGYFPMVFKYLFDSIGISVSNELNLMISRSIANVNTKYTLNQKETKALNNFGRIIVEIVKKFLSTELITIVFYSIYDYDKNANSTPTIEPLAVAEAKATEGAAKETGVAEAKATVGGVNFMRSMNKSSKSSHKTVGKADGKGDSKADSKADGKGEIELTELTDQKKEEEKPCKPQPCEKTYSSHANSIFSTMGNQILNSIVKRSIVGNGTEEEQKQNYKEYIESIENIKKNMPNLFQEFIQDMIGYMIITMPTNIILFVLAIIPSPLPHVLVDSMLKKIKQDLNAIINLIINAAGATTGATDTTTDTTGADTTGAVGADTTTGAASATGADTTKTTIPHPLAGGTRKVKRRNKYTKKYYLNRINNTIKNFYKTNKRKSRFNKRNL